jgi:hypothetical protein
MKQVFFIKLVTLNDIKKKMLFAIKNRKLLKKYGKKQEKELKKI